MSFQMVLVRPGQRTLDALAADVARTSWQARRVWDGRSLEEWMATGARVHVRTAHAADFAIAQRNWVSTDAVAAGGAYRHLSQAPQWSRASRQRPWQAWGTVEAEPESCVLEVNTCDDPDPARFCGRAATALAMERFYVGQPISVRRVELGPGMLGMLRLR